MALKDIAKEEQKVLVTLGDKDYQIRYPIRAFKELQEEFGGWTKAWNKMGNREEGSTLQGEINYTVLAKMLEIGIHQDAVTAEKIEAVLDEMMQDEIDPVIRSLFSARNRWAPVQNEKERTALKGLEEARSALVILGMHDRAAVVAGIAVELQEEVDALAADPQKKTR